MANAVTPKDKQTVLECVRDLTAAGQVDTLYRDLFLQRAVENLRSVFPESAFQQANEIDPQIAALLGENRRAVDRQDWSAVKSVSAKVEQLRKELRESADELAVAKLVYEAPAVAVDPLCVELQPLIKDQMTVSAARHAALEAFGRLATSDPDWAEFHRQRLAYFEAIQVVEADSEPSAEKQISSVAQLRQEAQKAAAAGDAARLAKLADEILKAEGAMERGQATADQSGAPALVKVPPEIQKPFDAAAVEKARALGFAHVEIKPQSPEIAEKIAAFAHQHQWRTAAAATEIAREGAIRLSDLMRGIELPEEMTEPLTTVLLMFAVNPFVSSAGIRYVVHFSSEYVLVEDFPEDGEVPNASELTKALKLRQRRSLARQEIEAALREHGAPVLEGQLGLDPKEYRLVCVPYDVYLRAGRDLGWGRQPFWTHVDGYQLRSGGRLRALVAGNTKFGGLLDLCSIGGDDAREGVLARFAVVRRARMAIGRV